ncbi:CMP-binding-factor 1 [Lachnospiraceae bacterium TWA4]|nr:CMP-binding-factor 1 [Lachnospiraceae bacterium TWA4]
MKYIKDLREGMRTSDIYFCKQKQALKTKAGKNYFSLILQDKTGTIDAKIWDLSNGINHFEAMDYIQVEGDVNCFQGALQMNVRRVRLAQEGEYVPSEYLPTTRYSVEDMYKKFLGYVNEIKNPHLSALCKKFFVEDEKFVKKFKAHSAAKSVHHGFVGGLLEHTLGVVKLCDFFASRYPLINRDLLLCAAMFHDVGKIKEISPFPENDYTDEGQLLGHIVMGVEMLDEAIRTIDGFPPKLALELKHCILAHHGEYEYGSPKKPAIMEAMALNLADNADAKLETMTELLENGKPEDEWLGYNKLFETNFKRTSK